MNKYGHLVEKYWLRKINVLKGKALFFITLLKENPTWTGLGINFGPRDERPRNNRMFMEKRVLKRKPGPKTQVVFHDPKSDNLKQSFINTLKNKINPIYLFLNNQPDAPIIQIYSVIKLHMFRACRVL